MSTNGRRCDTTPTRPLPVGSTTVEVASGGSDSGTVGLTRTDETVERSNDTEPVPTSTHSFRPSLYVRVKNHVRGDQLVPDKSESSIPSPTTPSSVKGEVYLWTSTLTTSGGPGHDGFISPPVSRGTPDSST